LASQQSSHPVREVLDFLCSCADRKTKPARAIKDQLADGPNEPGDEMEALLKAIGDLETSLAKAPNETVRAHMESACAAMRNAVESHKTSAPAADRLAMLHAIPEALVSCGPPSTATAQASSSEPVPELPPPLKAPLAEEVKTWSFDVHKIPAAELPALCFGAMMQHKEMQILPPLSQGRLWKYVQVVASRYRSNHFHSFRHAVDVTLGVSVLLRWLQEAKPGLLSDLQVVACLVSAMVHDTDHPGVMNNFLIATKHPLAVLYNHRSVLENHHVATAMALTSKPELDWLAPLAAADQAELRKAIIELVLATDVTTHIPFMKGFAADVEAGHVSATQAMHVLLKAADISNPTRPLGVYAQWVTGVMAEFFAQGDAERDLGLPISMNCDRNTVNVNKCQVGFISFIVAPIYKGIAAYMPAVEQQLLPVLQTNLEHYQAQAAAS